jgi:hypothetical protein
LSLEVPPLLRHNHKCEVKEIALNSKGRNIMKAIRMFALIVGLLPLSSSLAFSASEETSSSASYNTAQVEEAALALAYRAYLAVEKLDELYQQTGKTVLQRQAYLLRTMRVEALALAEDLKNGLPAEARQETLAQLLLQSEGYRRDIQAQFRSDRELTQKLGDVRRTGFYLQQLLNGEI